MNALATTTQEAQSGALITAAAQQALGFATSQGFEQLQRAAKLLASSTLVPKEYQNNLPNCVIALNMANRIGADPLLVMQNLYLVHGRPGWSAQFLIATFNQCGRFTAMRFEFFGDPGKDGYGCRAFATEKSTGERIVGADITIAIAKKEGWYSKSGSKWQSMPQQMLMYRAGSWLVRAYAPELSMGLQTTEELQDVGEQAITVTQAGRDPKALERLESELAGDAPTGAAESHADRLPITAQEVHDKLVNAQTQDELNDAGDLIRELPEDERPDLLGLWQARAIEVEA